MSRKHHLEQRLGELWHITEPSTPSPVTITITHVDQVIIGTNHMNTPESHLPAPMMSGATMPPEKE